MTGFDVSDPDHPMVIVNDPGSPDGQGAAYPLDRFMDAWENSNFHMTATDNPLPSFTALSIRDSISQYLADNNIQTSGPMLAGSSDSFDWGGLSDSIHDIAGPLTSICQDVAGTIAGVAGVVFAGNLLSDAFSGDDYAQWI